MNTAQQIVKIANDLGRVAATNTDWHIVCVGFGGNITDNGKFASFPDHSEVYFKDNTGIPVESIRSLENAK